jgi:hypothetical protein
MYNITTEVVIHQLDFSYSHVHVVCCCFLNLSAFLYDMASRRVFDVDDIVSVLGDSNENLSYGSSSGSDYEIFDADMSESGTSDSGSETLVTRVSSNWLQVTNCDCEYIE